MSAGMSSPAARTFLSTLRRLERDLTVPIPNRVRILSELESDLEGLRRQLEAQGVAPGEARARAVEALVPDGTTLRELGRLHAPLYQRVTRHVRGDRLRMVERSALVSIAVAVVVVETVMLLRVDVLTSPSPFIWPVVALGAVLFAVIIAKAFQLWVKRDHTKLSAGLRIIPGLSATIFAVGFAGTYIEFFRLASVLESTSADAASLFMDWLVQGSTLLALSILLALAGGLAWFLLAQWVDLVSEQRSRLLGLGQQIHTEREVTS